MSLYDSINIYALSKHQDNYVTETLLWKCYRRNAIVRINVTGGAPEQKSGTIAVEAHQRRSVQLAADICLIYNNQH